MKNGVRHSLATALLAVVLIANADPAPLPTYRQDVTGFVSAKGERALLMGYPGALEIWAYPLQLASDFQLRFRVQGTVAPIEAAPLLRRVDRSPNEVVRTYVGADFVVRERLFVPRQQAGAILRYEVEGKPDVQIEASFRPSLNLMWPAALGGRSVSWDATRSGYVEREPLHGFSATISSRETVAHDDAINLARAPLERYAMLLAPRAGGDGVRSASLVLALDPSAETDGAQNIRDSETAARRDAATHSAAVLAESIAIETPDPAVNRALASAALALDAAWACNDRIGCGVVGGYGPSRPDRRPQYAWFFAGDGLVVMEGMLAAGQFDRARQELAFVTRYQDPRTGMIWHEMSQSAGLIDWVGKYHYMYVHVDITFQYLAAVARYVETTGDVAFARRNWPAIAAAWRYCMSVIDRDTGIPTIPAGKQGQNEQEDLRDDIRLSSLWIDAADGYASLAGALQKPALVKTAAAAATRARRAIADNGWDDANGFWLSGHRRDGTPVLSQRPDAIGVLDQRVVSDARAARVLNRIASPDFLTDWGVRSLAASDPQYDPNLYSAGSVWALGSATVATTAYRQHRPQTGWAIWRAMVDSDTLDSAGHLHEVLAGDTYRPEFESVPEQSWSSAGLMIAAVRGVFGLSVFPAENRVRLAPHLPAEWDAIRLRNVRIGDRRVGLAIKRDAKGMTLTIDNPGDALTVAFAPVIPLGASLTGAVVEARPVTIKAVSTGQDNHAEITIDARARGQTTARIMYDGGVTVAPVRRPASIGDRSHNPILTSVSEYPDGLGLDAWVSQAAGGAFTLATDRVPSVGSGATIDRIRDGFYRITVAPGTGQTGSISGYDRHKVMMTFKP
ncbi:conserved exported hypothetical protein [Sphingomonas sp. EC-HK361]|uniref:amylo-alpha-1,6-glucosidase n=1 Tax=Sphingomonas sp. EC-HK361 TaxID=2038397 RepID=UPI0012540DBA|nr:amylo-alpha-1,6-glucosidase [Sphingomonas sp. EC-HK361]VVS96615.1 conserved exported hypothetical protein [Sphingomonas sp. EC-HK361]